MIEFNRILCPIDFSDTSLRALAHATALANWYEAQLEVVHVVPAFEHEDTGPIVAAGGPGPVLYAPAHEGVLAQIRSAIEIAGASNTHHRALTLEGRVHEMILKRAAALPADLIIVGTHGRGGFNRLFLGSIAEKVVRSAICPVLTVPPSAPAASARPILFKKILCPIDYSPSSLKALECALELGRQANGSVTVVHALEYMDPEASLEPSAFDPCRQAALDSRRQRQHRIDQARERLHAELAGEARTCCEIEEIVAINRAYKEILQRASASDVDLIVMGAQGSGGIELMLYGSNTHHVVRSATCPVLTVRA